MKTPILLSLYFTSVALAADDAALTFDHARAALHQPDRKDARAYWSLSIGFTKSVKESDLPVGRAGFKIFDTATGEDVTLVRIGSETNRTDLPQAVHNSPATQSFEVQLASDKLDPAHTYMLVAIGFQADGKSVALSTNLTFPDSKAKTPPAVKAASKPASELNKAKSDIYLNGEVDFVSEAPPGSRLVNGVADVKISYPFITRFPLFNADVHDQIFSPLFTLNASSLKNHDPNAMALGLSWVSVLGFANSELQQNFLLESTKNFSVADGVYSPSLHIPVKDIPLAKGAKLYLTPFFGGEFGGNFESPLVQARGAGCCTLRVRQRPHDILSPDQKEPIQGIGFDGQWMRRILAEKELAVDFTNPADLRLSQFGRSPRDHATANLKLAVTDSLSFTVGYEWGQLPPAYQMVHNLVKVGLLYQAQVKPH